MLDLAAHTSFRYSEKILNRIRHENSGVKACTIRNTTEREGKALLEQTKKQAKEALVKNGFSEKGVFLNKTEIKKIELEHIEDEIVMVAAAELKLDDVKPQ